MSAQGYEDSVVGAARDAGPGSGPAQSAGAVEALRALADQPRVAQAEAAVREASTALRWNEALRRRWREARAEAAVRSAVASAAVTGAVVPAEVLRGAVADRALTRATTGDPALDAAAGLWRAHTRLATWWPDLRGPARPAQPAPRSLLAALHRDVVGPAAAAGQVPMSDVATPRRPGTLPLEAGPDPAPGQAELTARLEALLDLIDAPGVPALVRAAVVHAELACARPFTTGNAALGRLLARHLVTRDGLEPTGVAVPDLHAAQDPAAYTRALAAYATGAPEGVTSWITWQAQALLAGIDEAASLCRAVQAGTTAAG